MGETLFGPNGFVHADEDENGNVTIMWAGKPYYSFSRTDHFARNLGICLLASQGVRHKDIQRLFGVSGMTIKQVLAPIKKKGPSRRAGETPRPTSATRRHRRTAPP